MNNQNIFFSVVIPTMWKSNRIIDMFKSLNNCDLVKEIIIIDNDPKSKLILENSFKLKYYTEFKNIYVNPAWNVGYKISNYNLILCNDDINIPNIEEVLIKISNSNFDIVGLDWNKSDSLNIKKIDEFPKGGYGCFMYVKNYTKIPDKYKIFRCDFILFEHNKNRGILSNPSLSGEIGTTVKSNLILHGLAIKDLNI